MRELQQEIEKRTVINYNASLEGEELRDGRARIELVTTHLECKMQVKTRKRKTCEKLRGLRYGAMVPVKRKLGSGIRAKAGRGDRVSGVSS